MGQYNGTVVVGSFIVAGTPAVTKLDLGFVPGTIKFTVLSGTNEGKTASWNSLMADDSAIVADSLIAANGVTPVKNLLNANDGVNVGTLAGIANIAADVVLYEAIAEAKG